MQQRTLIDIQHIFKAVRKENHYMKVSYEDYLRLKRDNNFSGDLVLKDLRENQPDTYAKYEKAFSRAKQESVNPERGLSLVYDDISNYQEFKETLQRANEESEYHGGTKVYSKRLNRFIERDRQQYLEYMERLKQESRMQ